MGANISLGKPIEEVPWQRGHSRVLEQALVGKYRDCTGGARTG